MKIAEKFSRQIENTEGKGEIACYEQFLLFPQRFQETCTADLSKPGLVWERVNTSWNTEILNSWKLYQHCSIIE